MLLTTVGLEFGIYPLKWEAIAQEIPALSKAEVMILRYLAKSKPVYYIIYMYFNTKVYLMFIYD